jgi:hypothetical protein
LLQPGEYLSKQRVFHGLLADHLTEPADLNGILGRLR